MYIYIYLFSSSSPVVEDNGGDPACPTLLQLIIEVLSESSPEEGRQPDQRGGWREGVPVHLTDDVIIQGHDVTQFSFQQTFPLNVFADIVLLKK